MVTLSSRAALAAFTCMKVIAKRSCSLLEVPFCVFNCQPVTLLVTLKLSRSEVKGASISFREEALDSDTIFLRNPSSKSVYPLDFPKSSPPPCTGLRNFADLDIYSTPQSSVSGQRCRGGGGLDTIQGCERGV